MLSFLQPSNSTSLVGMQVYTEYDPADPPPHPGPAWTRFVCISDTHSKTCSVPEGDALLHAGDLSSWGYVPQLETTVEWLAGLPHPIKMCVPRYMYLAVFKC